MFTKLELRLLGAIFFLTASFSAGVYAVYNNSLTLGFLSFIIAFWSTGMLMIAGAISAHLIQNRTVDVRRIIVKDY